MDVSRLTPEELQRLTPEERTRLTPEQRAAALEILDPNLRLTPDEEKQREAARTIADPDTWSKIVSTTIEPALHSYTSGELTFDEMLDYIDRISIGCLPQARMTLLGTIAYLARRRPRRELKTRPPLYPECVRSGTADLILSLKVESPRQRVTPHVSSRRKGDDFSSPLIRKALAILTTIHWFGPAGPPSASTIARWVQLRRKRTGQALPQGRPRTSR